MSGASYRETEINGIPATLWNHSDAAPVRRLAASLDRSDDGIREVTTDVGHDATIWFNHDEYEQKLRRIRAPDGFEIAYVDHLRDGTLAITVDEVDA